MRRDTIVARRDTARVLEFMGHEEDRAMAKHQAAQRWISAVGNWGKPVRWDFHVCRNPQKIDKALASF